MATRIQLSLFKTPESLNIGTQGFSMPDEEILPTPPKVETNATRKRNQRRSWYIQTQLKGRNTDGPTVA